MSAPWLGLLLGSQRRTDSAAELFAAVEAEAAAAIAAGISVLVAPEHLHAEPYAMLRPWPLLAALRARFDGAVATVGSVIAGLSSVPQTLGDLATLRAVGTGRVGAALAAGYRPEDFAAAGRDFADRYSLRATMREALVDEHWTWSAAANERAARRAVEAGAAWYGGPTLSDGDAVAVACAVDGPAVLRRDVLLGSDRADVRARWERWVAPKYGAYARWGYAADGGAAQVVAGTADEVGESLSALIAAARPAGIVLRLCWPDMDARAGLDHVRAFGTEVAPAIELSAATRRN
jgi:alkanesulfonate monooxygenase SsuD/methylene tetrahydromethanopterin reductase-like flavin-dependent oxidoreductase (luciferase family)